ncbi:MAG: methionyl-tRNA formyltransferase [Gemmiger sp.]
MRILFMGTPDIAAESLAALLDAGHEVCAVFTRRDKPVGRKQILTAPPVKQLAVEHGIPVYQPRTLRDGSSDDIIREAPDVVVVGPGCQSRRSFCMCTAASIYLAAAEIPRLPPIQFRSER